MAVWMRPVSKINDRGSVASGRRTAFHDHQGNDDVLFVVKVTGQAGGGAVQHVGQLMGMVGGVGRWRRDGLMESDGGMEEGVQMRVDGVVVAVQQVEAGLDARLDQAELREVVAALDAVVAVQMLEEGLQYGHEGGVQTARVKPARAPVCSGVGHLPLLGAKTRVHLQPEGGGFGQGLGPALTREGVA